jgi:epoxyqueuosine reductase QueG
MHFLDELLPLWGACEYEGSCVIAAAFPYCLPEDYYQGRNVSRYAVVQDYHNVCGARLEQACAKLRQAYPEAELQCSCDNSPLPEVELALRAGLGVRGRHNLLITEPFGSWVFLGAVRANMWIPQPGVPPAPPQSPCLHCAAPCVAVCPTGALNNKTFDRSRCLSAITQRKGALSPEERALLQRVGTVWGCDLCQEVCPCNRRSKRAPLPEFLRNPIAHVTAETPLHGRAYAWRGKAVLHRNLGIRD